VSVGDEPVEGWFKTRLVKDGVFVPVRIWWGQPLDEDGEVMDRHMRWNALASGKYIDVERVWPWCGRFPISEADYRFMLDKSRWAKSYSPDRPEASPREAVDWNQTPTKF